MSDISKPASAFGCPHCGLYAAGELAVPKACPSCGTMMDDTEIPIEQKSDSRKAAEQAYTVSAFDYPGAPIGSRDWCLFWKGWQACMNSFCLTDALATRRNRDEWRNHADSLAQQTFIAEQKLSAAEQQRDEWKAKAEANERDARRYQWLRDEWWLNDDPEDLQPDLNMVHAETAEQFDASIDAARNAEKEKE